MKKSLLGGALIVALIAGLFVLTGCEKKEKETTTNTNGSANTSSSTPVDTSNDLVQATEFYVQNSFPNNTTVKEIYASVTGLDSWSPNLIAGLELAPGTRVRIGLGLTAATTNWDLKLVDEEGTSLTLASIDLSSVLSQTAETVELTVSDTGDIVALVK